MSLSFDFSTLRAAYRDRTANPAAVAEEVIARIAVRGEDGVWISRVPDDVLRAEAIEIERRAAAEGADAMPLYGLPFAVKDNIDVAGLPTTCACPAFAYTPASSAPVVERVRRAGALLVGKTNLDQFATGLVGLRTPYPAPRNAFDPGVVPGGSSSGSAVAVAAGLVAFAIGTDTGGSGRVPAGLNNLVGLKPTRGVVSTRGVVPACRTLDCVSVFALTVGDAAAVYREIAGFDPEDPYSRTVAPPPPPAGGGLRIGVPDRAGRRFGGDALAERAFGAAVHDLAALGGALEEVDLAPFFAAGKLLYEGPWVAERYASVGDFVAARPEAVDPTVRRIIAAAAGLSAADAFAGQYRLAELRRATAPVWQSVDVLLVPTVPRPCRVAEVAADPIGANSDLGTYTGFVNLLDLCALAVPGRFRDDGFPAGVTLIAPAGSDERLAAVGTALHARAEVPLGALGGFAVG